MKNVFKILIFAFSFLLTIFLTSCNAEDYEVSSVRTGNTSVEEVKSTDISTGQGSINENIIRDNVSVSEISNTDVSAVVKKLSEDYNTDVVIDANLEKAQCIEIRTEAEYRRFIENVQRDIDAAGGNLLDPRVPNQYATFACADGVYSGSGLTSGYATLTFDIAVTNGCISGISGAFTGWTLGVSYTQGGTSFGCNSGTVCGTVNYNIFYEGIGTIYSQRVCYRIRLNC